jgi:hypothetical protein
MAGPVAAMADAPQTPVPAAIRLASCSLSPIARPR